MMLVANKENDANLFIASLNFVLMYEIHISVE